MFECTSTGSTVQFTVWKGSALRDCSSGRISLRHGKFLNSGYANGTCNNGAIWASITSANGNSFKSQLVINTSLELDGKSIECAADDGIVEAVIDTATINIITG